MKIVLETKQNTKYRKNELEKFKRYLEVYYNYSNSTECPFGNEFGFSCKECGSARNIKECIEKHINNLIQEIDKEGVLYL